MNEARRVVERLDRIESLRGEGASPRRLLDEVRLLLAESEAWVQSDVHAEEAKEVIDKVKNALERGETTAPDGENGALEPKRTLVA